MGSVSNSTLSPPRFPHYGQRIQLYTVTTSISALWAAMWAAILMFHYYAGHMQSQNSFHKPHFLKRKVSRPPVDMSVVLRIAPPPPPISYLISSRSSFLFSKSFWLWKSLHRRGQSRSVCLADCLPACLSACLPVLLKRFLGNYFVLKSSSSSNLAQWLPHGHDNASSC